MQQRAQGESPYKNAGGKAGPIAYAQRACADLKAEIQPCKKECGHKQSVCKMQKFALQRAQKIINQAKAHAKKTRPGEVNPGYRRRRHPNRRRSQLPPCRGSS